jgi:hypothetical protein
LSFIPISNAFMATLQSWHRIVNEALAPAPSWEQPCPLKPDGTQGFLPLMFRIWASS